jgi:hypothetical protein
VGGKFISKIALQGAERGCSIHPAFTPPFQAGLRGRREFRSATSARKVGEIIPVNQESGLTFGALDENFIPRSTKIIVVRRKNHRG